MSVPKWQTLLQRGLPIAFNVLREVFNGIANGATNEEIRQRVADPDVILDDALDQLRSDEDDLLDYVRTGR